MKKIIILLILIVPICSQIFAIRETNFEKVSYLCFWDSCGGDEDCEEIFLECVKEISKHEKERLDKELANMPELSDEEKKAGYEYRLVEECDEETGECAFSYQRFLV